jgi:hypothetical protein
MALYKGEDKIKDIYLGDVPIFKVYAGEEFCGFFTFSHENLISNSDLLIDSDSDNVPDGFNYANVTDISLTNGVAKFTATVQYAYLNYTYNFTANDLIYFYAKFKSDSNLVGILGANNDSVFTFHSGSGNYEFISNIKTATPYNNVRLSDRRSSDWTPIEVDYMGAINITDLVYRGILPSGLTNSQYKDILDNYFNS